ncbi:helix-hairpin-helix domain-containing protein [Lactovum odontotermitis]
MNIQKLIEKAKEHWQIAAGVFAALVVIGGFFVFNSLAKSPRDNQLPEITASLTETNSSDLSTKKSKPAENSSALDSSTSSSASGKIVVDVKGAVRKPSIYTVEADLRVNDIIQMAGGFTDNAEQKSINLAAKISDAQVIYVPTTDEKAAPAAAAASTTAASPSDSTSANEGNSAKVNINTADLTQLQTLSGVGQKKAQDIIDYRTQNGPFKSADELGNVSGFGPKSLEKLKESITVD